MQTRPSHVVAAFGLSVVAALLLASVTIKGRRSARAELEQMVAIVPVSALDHYSTTVPYPNIDSKALTNENEGNSWIGTNDAFFNTNGGGYGWAHGARFQGLGAVFNDPLPEERFYETDGTAPKPICPGAWCEKTPLRLTYKDSREAETGDPAFPVAWGPCNIAIQDC
mmetsp:Transcript_14745/g.35031  ORF Transcript_14745/g.35031 Transcript_14745/m.35031 type:complete len:168 (+) Transcript_14745:16-519(+)